ncbi:MAG: glycosyl hydrolase, partial [Marinilabiliales bacterium]|nr:glycosyl hydrolase [Marinilabiliales bacterium]
MKRIKNISFVAAVMLLACQQPQKSVHDSDTKVGVLRTKATVYVTAKDTALQLTRVGELPLVPMEQPTERDVCIFVDPQLTFQTLTGIGGALTDASAEVFAALTPSKQQQLMEAYYDLDKGIGYNFARTNIASCDFSSDSYGYVADQDTSLSSFSVAHDEKFKIPLIRKATQAAGGKLPLFVSPWSPPAWMKDNKDLLHGGKLLPQYRTPWANHYVRFIKTYESMGIPIWGLSVQNEPMAVQKWESCNYSAVEERDFVKGYLGPILEKNGLAEKKLIVWDHNRDQI